MSDRWDYECRDCGWQGLIDEPVYDDDHDGLAMCPDCGSKNIKLWTKDEEEE